MVGDTVEISQDGKLLKTRAVKHEPIKAHGAFANPGDKPDRINAASESRGVSVVEEPETECRAGTAT